MLEEVAPGSEAVQPESSMSVEGRDDIYLRLARPGDEVELYAVLTNDRPESVESQRWDEGFSPKGVKAELDRSLSEIEAGRMMRYRIIHKQTNTDNIIGEVSFFQHDSVAQSAKLGYWITGGFEGQGIVLASARQLIKYATQFWNLKHIVLTIKEGNARSEHLAQILGAHLIDQTEEETGNAKVEKHRVWEINNA